jgi:Bacterial protein of unknown function (DUF885)
VNTYALHNRPLYVLEALTLHEAVPGHHLQIALQQELKGLPDFRRFAGAVAFVEGWALYSEWLGVEAGFYTDPYSQFGRLTYEMWRACRLVVDTGIHAMSWTRGEAMDFLASNTALSLHEVKTETDRYIASPGQALAYKIGELKIRQLRKEAEQALGESFDVREFHDVVLQGGAIPLGVLERQVRSYVERALQPGYLPMKPNGDPMFRGSQFNSRINGGQSMTADSFLDGAAFGYASGHQQTHESSPPIDAIKEMKVITSTYSAQYGHTSGGRAGMYDPF